LGSDLGDLLQIFLRLVTDEFAGELRLAPPGSLPVSKSNFSVARITTSSFAVAMFALTGCSVGLQAEGAAEFDAIAADDMADAITDALDRQSGVAYADASSLYAPELSALDADRDETMAPDPDQVVEEDPVEKPVEETAPEPVDESSDEPSDEPSDETSDEPSDETSDESSDETSDEPKDEDAQDEDDRVDEEPEEEELDQGEPDTFTVISYGNDHDAMGLMAEIIFSADGSAQLYGSVDLGEGAMDLTASGSWESSEAGAVMSTKGDSRNADIIASGLVADESCSYLMGGTLAVRGDGAQILLSFSEGCDSCMGVTVGDEDLGKVCFR
jgi:hypothetical protein